MRLGSSPCPCRRAFPVIESIEGRQDDFIQTPSGRWIGRLGWVVKDVPHLKEAQIVQESLDLARILVVVDRQFGAEQEAHLRNNFAVRVGQDVRVVIERVERIERTGSGKFKLVVSRLGSPARVSV